MGGDESMRLTINSVVAGSSEHQKAFRVGTEQGECSGKGGKVQHPKRSAPKDFGQLG